MLNSKYRLIASLAICALIGLGSNNLAFAKTKPQHEAPKIEIVIALDVSGSMSGLLESAKQRLWDIVNELGRAQPQPELRLAILSFGNPGYGAQSGFVRIDSPFTSDLDAINETLFGFGTEGGDEFVARVIDTSVNELDWSRNSDTLRIIFVAGNEEADQDPQISLQQATRNASEHGIVVNTIYCGEDGDAIAAGWRRVATMTNGLFASIDQNSAAVANIATPMDNELVKLNKELNETYLGYGKTGEERKRNQLEQDNNAVAMSPSAVASRTVTKASHLYNNFSWDLVDAWEFGEELSDIDRDDLPVELQHMSNEEQENFVAAQADKRKQLQLTIHELDKSRRVYTAQERAKQVDDGTVGLDDVIQQGLRSLAEKKGFSFDE